MFRSCITCDQPTIVGRYVDNYPIVMDATPCTDGEAILKGDRANKPTVIFGIESDADADYWGVPVPFDADRYNKHQCKEI